MHMRQVSLIKNGQTHIFRYRPGLEDEVVEEMMHQADCRDSALDWMDAANLSFQVTQLAAEDCLGTAD